MHNNQIPEVQTTRNVYSPYTSHFIRILFFSQLLHLIVSATFEVKSLQFNTEPDSDTVLPHSDLNFHNHPKHS